MADLKHISFFVPGNARPAGSKIPGMKKNGKLFARDDCKDTKNWQAIISTFALKHRQRPLLAGPLRLDCLFYLKRPLRHYVANKYARGLKANAPYYKSSMPDGLKLRRAVEDALTGIVWVDDAQVVTGKEDKIYSGPDGAIGVQIDIAEIADPGISGYLTKIVIQRTKEATDVD